MFSHILVRGVQNPLFRDHAVRVGSAARTTDVGYVRFKCLELIDGATYSRRQGRSPESSIFNLSLSYQVSGRATDPVRHTSVPRPAVTAGGGGQVQRTWQKHKSRASGWLAGALAGWLAGEPSQPSGDGL